MIKALSMIYAIENINNSTLLPGITLGYEMYDSCSDPLKAIQATLRLIPESVTIKNVTECNQTEVIPAVKAVVGEQYSEMSISMSRILSIHFIPQISPASSAATLSDKVRFPSFLRTVPSDTHQTKAIAKLIRTLGWNWVGVITSDDDYGRSALHYLNIFLREEGICTAFSQIISTYVDHPSLPGEISNITNELVNCSANVVVVFVKAPIVIKLFKESIRRNISRTWIASDIWSNSNSVSRMENIEKVGTILGLNFKLGHVPGFAEFLKNLQPPRQGAINTFLDEYKTLRFGCTEEYIKYLECISSSSKDCNHSDSIQQKSPLACKVENVSFANDDYLVHSAELSTVYSTYLAVTAIAQALKNIVCRNGKCEDLTFSPHKLLNELKNNNFSYNGEMFHFDRFGDILNGYNVINWITKNSSTEFRFVGKYDILDAIITLNRSLFWNTEDSMVPISNCSKQCTPGHYKKHSFISCCYECIPCTEGYYSPAADMNECLKCPITQWSANGSARCENRTIEYFRWNDPFAIVLTSFAALGFLLVLIIAIVFIKHADTPAVKAAGGNYTYLLCVSLLFSLVSIGFFIGQPSDIFCQIRQPLYGISFTLCVSCILIKSVRILLAFESGKRGRQIVTITYQPAVVISVLTGFQLCVSMLWLFFKGPFVTKIYTIPQLLSLQCDEGSYVGFGIMLGFICFLAFACFILAFKGRKLPEKYNEARCITFSMLIYLFIWIGFIPIYINTSGMYLSAVQVIAIIASNYGVISCHLFPACYIILFKRKSNNRARYLQCIHAFCKAQRSVLSLSQNNSDFQVPPTDITAGAAGLKNCTMPVQNTLSATLSVRRRRFKSC
ncbi:hypothetical protein FKM82_010978 [Ascaphus truei]